MIWSECNSDFDVGSTGEYGIVFLRLQPFEVAICDLKLRKMKMIHDRFIILDKKEGYLIGASLKDAGKKCFGVTKLQDSDTIKGILERLKK